MRNEMTSGKGVGSIKRFIVRHRYAVGAVAVALLGLAVFVVVWFEPQKLFLNEKVDEALPGADTVASEQPSDSRKDDESDGKSRPRRSMQPKTLSSGRFRSLEHTTSGTAAILELPDGRKFLRFDDLDTSNGPDLRVYLSEIPAGDDWFAYGKRFVDLGDLKGNIGDQNYLLPDDIDLERYHSAVIWCRRFKVGFGVAPLN